MKSNLYFSRTDYFLFITSVILLISGFLCMALDPAPNGFGILTLWIAPLLLAAGFIVPVFGILGVKNLPTFFNSKTFSWKVHLTGFAVFIIALAAYIKTLAPAASLWDCSEFIASAYKLQVPHTPGAPLFLLTGRIFTMFSFGNPGHVAWTMNFMSALYSSLGIYFLFFIISLLSKRLPESVQRFTPAAAATGCLCLAFSDSFWFSAVEAETYGAAGFFLIFLVWMGLKGNQFSGHMHSRWLVLIFYLTGLSYCIHPMCLLSVPVVAVIWYFKNRDLSLKNIIIATASGFFILLFINRFIAVGLFEIAFCLDLFLVNRFGFPFYSGAILLLIILSGSFIFLIKKRPQLQTISWSVVFLLLGFAPYLILFIRSGHNPPIDEASPEGLNMIKAYMNRESYPGRPLMYGQYFDAQIEDIGVKKEIYTKGAGTYELAGVMPEYRYEPSRCTILPRMYSRDESHVEFYRSYTGLAPHEKPGFIDNIKYMLGYQLGHMYFRYLMWNFAGRASDVQHAGWLKPWQGLSLPGKSGISNHARNQYWMLPLFLGLAGMFFQYKKDKKGFLVTLLFFLITGVILALYLNPPPVEPRERDYIYVGSFVAYSIWIGMGIMAIAHFLKKKFKGVYLSAFLVAVAAIGIPAWMFYQNYDDHDRSGRTLQVDHARNILNSCAPNAILFTAGDNDTFPLWYLQEVEGFRTDVRVVVLSYLNTNWYISQLRNRYYESEAFQLTLDAKDYRQYGPNDALYIYEKIKGPIHAEKYLRLLHEEHPALKVNTRTGDSYHILPSRILRINAGDPKSEIILEPAGNYLEKNALAFIDLLVSNGWERPFYFNFTSMNNIGLNIKPYLVQEGQVYRFLPVKNKGARINKELMYANLVEKADYSNLQDRNVYFNFEDYHLRIISPIRQSLNTLAEAYLRDGNVEMAQTTIDYAVKNLYGDHLLPSFSNLSAAKILLTLGRSATAKSLAKATYLYYFDRVNRQVAGKPPDELDLYMLTESANILKHLGEDKYAREAQHLLTTVE